MYICSLRYPACNAHAPYCHLWPVPLYNIFPHYLINSTIFEKKKLLNTKCVFWFSVQILSDTFLILKKKMGEIWSNMCIALRSKYALFLFRFDEGSWIFSTVFQKTFNNKFHKKYVQWESDFSMRTDMKRLVVAIHNFANAPNEHVTYVVGSKSFRPDIQKPRQM